MKRLVLVIAGCLVVLLASRYIVGSWDWIVALSVLFVAYIIERLMRANGYAAAAQNGALGMPTFLRVCYILIPFLMIGMMWPIPNEIQQTNASFMAVGLAGLTGWCIGLIDWYTINS